MIRKDFVANCGKWFFILTLFQLLLLEPAFAFELIISDTGRNQSWLPEPALEQGASFSDKGADNQPIGGVLFGTRFIEQFVLPMPSIIELDQMSQGQERVWIVKLSELLKDRVHIAITNEASLFEIRLLQNAQPENSTGAAFAKNQGLARFGRMAYSAIGRLVTYLKSQDIPVRVTTALADTGGSVFVQAKEAWKPYASVFRRVDFVDSHINQEEVGKVIQELGGKRVRIFNTAGEHSAPIFTTPHKAQVLLSRHPALTLYKLWNNKGGNDSLSGTTPWMVSLSGLEGLTVDHYRLINGQLKVESLARAVAGQEFRAPLAGWDPLNFDLHSTQSLKKLGVNVAHNLKALLPVIGPLADDPNTTGATVGVERQSMHAHGQMADSNPKTIRLSSNSATIPELELMKGMVKGEKHIFLKGSGEDVERLYSDLKESGTYGKISQDPLLTKPTTGAVVEIGIDIKASSHRGDPPVPYQFENRSFERPLRSSQFQDRGLVNRWSERMRPGNQPVLPGNDVFKFKPPDYTSISLGGQLPPPGPGRMQDVTSQMFPISTALNRSYMYRDRPMPFQPNVRGVLLRGAAKVEGGTKTLNAGDVSLIFQDSAGIIDIGKLRRFVTSLWAVYLSVEGPGISIDPIAPKLDKHQVRYIGQVRNLDIAQVMRETDYLMKQWAIGTHRPDIDNFLNPDDISGDTNKRSLNRMSRFWFIPENLRFKRSGNMLLATGGRMTLKTEYLDSNSKTEKNEANEKFAKWFTENYDLIAERYPIYQKLFDYAQLSSLATYLKENRVPMLWFLLANRELILTENSIDNVDKLVKRSGYKWYVNIYGGVELETTKAIRNKELYESDTSLDASHTLAVENQNAKGLDAGPVVFNNRATDYTVASNQSLMLADSQADGDILQTDFAAWSEHQDAVEENKWELITPGLEIIRYYHPTITTPGQLGDGWHVLIPFRLDEKDKEKEEGLTSKSLPTRVDFVNVLSGQRETLLLSEGIENDSLRYGPIDKNSLTTALYRYSDGTWQVQDKLGGTFVFDRDGHLTRMTLRPVETITIKVGEKHLKKTIPEYAVTYGYAEQNVGGNTRKLLTKVEQGDKRAVISWSFQRKVSHIESINIYRAGQSIPAETLTYDYGPDGKLIKVTTKSGREVSFEYRNANMNVMAQQ